MVSNARFAAPLLDVFRANATQGVRGLQKGRRRECACIRRCHHPALEVLPLFSHRAHMRCWPAPVCLPLPAWALPTLLRLSCSSRPPGRSPLPPPTLLPPQPSPSPAAACAVQVSRRRLGWRLALAGLLPLPAAGRPPLLAAVAAAPLLWRCQPHRAASLLPPPLQLAPRGGAQRCQSHRQPALCV